MEKLNIVIPILNEAKNLPELVKRIAQSMKGMKTDYEIIFVDDFSTDNSKRIINSLSKRYPIVYMLKSGKRGKGYSILQGAQKSRVKYIAMLDGDLQYAPEYIPQMLEKAEKEDLGIVIGNRVTHNEGAVRSFVSKVGHLIYGKLLLGLDMDTQSGLKLFKRSLADHLSEKDVKPWAFDLPLLHTALETGEEIGSVDIDFLNRKNGKSKINFFKTAWQIVTTALKLRFNARKAYHLKPKSKDSMVGAGVIYKRNKFITHTTLHHSKSALITFTPLQKIVILLTFLTLLFGLFVNAQGTEIVFIAILSVIYFADVLFGLYLVLKSLNTPPEIHFDEKRLKRIKDDTLPVYTVLSPLYKEEHILPQFLKNINKLDWPKDKLDVILLLEEDDVQTIGEAKKIDLPPYVRILVVPDGQPKTKPKACNYGLAHAKGEYVVIYDAEDEPEPLQLKKAFLGFQNLGPNVFCLQAKLNYYNPNQNLLTRLFTAEYSLWFDIVLPGLQAINTTIPLGGTSNHFRTAGLKKLEGWDPFNVAEDADLGARLFRQGYKTAIIDSVTLEEANSNIKNWIRQRSRWLKGYMQTYFVQMRQPLKFAREKKQHYLIFQLVSGLRVSFMLINPLLWAMTLAYFLLFKFVGPQIEALYPTQVFYMAVFSLVFGNFLYLYYYMIGAAKREEWGIIKYVFLVPFYWLLTSIGAFMASYQLIFKPHYWEKTIHGLQKVKKEEVKVVRRIEFKFIKDLGVPGVANIKAFIKSDFFSGAFLVAASMLANVLNFLYNAYLGRKLDLEDFGTISLVGSLVYIIGIPISGLSRTVTHKSAFLFGKYSTYVKKYWTKVRSKSLKASYVLAIGWLVLTPILAQVFKSESILPFAIFVPMSVIGIVGSVDSGFLTGSHLFIVYGLAVVLEALTKLVLSIVFLEIGFRHEVVLATPLSMLVSFTLSYLFILKLKSGNEVTYTNSELSFPTKFFVSSIASKITTIAFLSLDLIMVKLFLSPTDAGRYAILSLVGKMVFIIGSIFTTFIIPVVSKREGEGLPSERSFYKILGANVFASTTAFLIFGPLGRYTTPFMFGPKVYSIVEYLPIYAFAILLQTIASAIVNFHQVKDRHVFSYLGFVFSLCQIFVMVIFHRNIYDIVLAMVSGGAIYLASMILLHFYYGRFKTFISNFIDFLGIFTVKKDLKVATEKSAFPRILIFNWRDTKHVWSGGAEVYIHEIAKRLVKMGYKVTVFCGNDQKSLRNEKVDGVQVIRRGGFFTVYLWAFLYYVFRLHKYFDVIIDSENGIPFFTPLYSKKKIFLLIHHVHQDLFRIKLHPPLSYIGKFLEKEVMPWVYKETEVITVSPSSKADILEHEITAREPHIIYNGVDTGVYKPGKKSASPMVLYLGRLTPQKSLSVFIKSAKKILRKMPKVEFVIAGDGVDKKKLIKLAKALGLEKKITFTGKVSEAQKVRLYQKAWVFMNPSLMEGWGITSIEANACGTPVVASNVAGLRDSVHNPHSGLLVPYGDVDEFTKATVNLLQNKTVRKRMSTESVEWAKKFDWDKSTGEFLQFL